MAKDRSGFLEINDLIATLDGELIVYLDREKSAHAKWNSDLRRVEVYDGSKLIFTLSKDGIGFSG